MPLVTTPTSPSFLFDTSILEYASIYPMGSLINHTGYVKVQKDGVFLCEIRPHFNTAGYFTIDVSDLIPLDIQAPGASITGAGVTAGLIPGAWGILQLSIGEVYEVPETIEITTTLNIDQVYGASKYWEGIPAATSTFLAHDYHGVIKEVYFDQPEIISVFSKSGGLVGMTISVITTSGTAFATPSATVGAGVSYITASPAQMGLPANTVSYTISVLGKEIKYIVLPTKADNARYILVDNRLGGLEVVRIAGAKTYNTQSQGSRFEKTKWVGDSVSKGTILEGRKGGNDTIKCNTGYINQSYARHLSMLALGKIWLIDTDRSLYLRYSLDQSSIDVFNDGEDLYAVEFTIAQGFTDFSSGSLGL